MDSDIGSSSRSRCYKVNCSNIASIIITIGSTDFYCDTPGATVLASSPYSGSFRCPDDFYIFCSRVPNSSCNPGQNGICLPDGRNLCGKGHGGIGCNPITCHSNCMVG